MQFSHLLGKLKLNQQEFIFQFQSHPQHPSALAFSDTLNFMGLKNDAYELDKDFWGELPAEFITIYNNNFTLVKMEDELYRTFSDNTQVITKDTLYKSSSNFILLFENEEKNNVNKKINYQYLILFSLGLLLIYSFLQLKWYEGIFNTLSIIGIYISLELFSEKFGYDSNVINNICGATTAKTQTSCAKIVDSDKTDISGLKLSDLSLIYFTGLLMIGIFLPSTGLVLKIASGISFFVILYSLYVQILVEKIFCRICFIINTLLILQICLSNIYFTNWISGGTLFLSVLAMGTSFITLSFINTILKEKLEYHKASIKHLKFKRDYEIFRRELLDHEKITFINKRMFFLGNKEAKLHISLISNPYCGFCRDAHKILEKLLQQYPDDVSAQIRFNYSAKIEDKNFTNLINDFVYIYTSSKNHLLEAVDNWFENRSEKKIRLQYNPEGEISDLTEINETNLENEIKGFNFTPIFLINGYQLPKKYDREEIFYFIDDLLEEENIW
ncbi:vitamin K epoxide reductase family protein [Chryseobacterium sp. KACC 21268]|nr:vitamin K epoxide reductase family protein [Chryseobacterium sp. KACC 21268]